MSIIQDHSISTLQYAGEVSAELDQILLWWMQHMPDKNDGFHGSIDSQGIINEQAERGVVLNSRILWTFSAAFRLTGKQEYLSIANRAFHYLHTYFQDREFGGMYWSVDAEGHAVQDKKQVYGIAFCLYGMTEYYRATRNDLSLQIAQELFSLLEKNSREKLYGGYLEAFTRSWEPIADLRLSDKDANEKKTMNTHLHVLEAYANLYRIWPNEEVVEALRSLLYIFRRKIILPTQWQQGLFFSEEWELRSSIVSFGHDIEAAWLLYDAAILIGDTDTKAFYSNAAVQMAEASLAGVDGDGGMWYDWNIATGRYNKEKHWWPQAEAMIGFLQAWEISKDDRFLQQSVKSWLFIQEHIIDRVTGEWKWGIDASGNDMLQEEKAGFWKCPYHNARACMEVYGRLTRKTNLH